MRAKMPFLLAHPVHPVSMLLISDRHGLDGRLLLRPGTATLRIIGAESASMTDLASPPWHLTLSE